MTFTRREFLRAAGAATVAGGLPAVAFSADKEIKLGSILDNSGNLDIYGKPMVIATKLAVDEINEAGGLLGRKIKLIQYDSQSDIVLYEGGVCDRNTVVTGTTPAQAVEPIMERAMKQWGSKVYVLAADYNYG